MIVRSIACAGACFFAVTTAEARDFGKERLAGVIAEKWGASYALVMPMFAVPAADSDPMGFGLGYLGSVAKLSVAPGRNGVGRVLSHEGSDYCNPDDLRPAAAANTKRLKDYIYRFEVKLTGEFTVTGAKTTDTIFKLKAIDAQWLDYFALDITNTKLLTLPANIVKARYASAASKGAECAAYRYGFKSALSGDVTARFYFRRGITSDILFNVGKSIQANFNFTVEGKQGESQGKPFVEFTEGNQIFALSVDKLK